MLCTEMMPCFDAYELHSTTCSSSVAGRCQPGVAPATGGVLEAWPGQAVVSWQVEMRGCHHGERRIGQGDCQSGSLER